MCIISARTKGQYYVCGVFVPVCSHFLNQKIYALVSEFLRLSLKAYFRNLKRLVNDSMFRKRQFFPVKYLTFHFFPECHILRNVMEAIKKQKPTKPSNMAKVCSKSMLCSLMSVRSWSFLLDGSSKARFLLKN